MQSVNPNSVLSLFLCVASWFSTRFSTSCFSLFKKRKPRLPWFQIGAKKQHWQWTIFIKIYGRAFVWLSQSGPDYNQIPIIWTKLSKLSFRAPLKCLEPEFHIHKKQRFDRVASKAFQKCAESPILQKGASPQKYFKLCLWDHHYPNCHRRAVKSQNMRPKTSLCSAIQDTENSNISHRMRAQYHFHIFGASIQVKMFDS